MDGLLFAVVLTLPVLLVDTYYHAVWCPEFRELFGVFWLCVFDVHSMLRSLESCCHHHCV